MRTQLANETKKRHTLVNQTAKIQNPEGG